jgi:hypothetical protein
MARADGGAAPAPKPVRYENESYRRFVAGHACFACGVPKLSQCAHANGGGGATKASDLETFPLCSTRPGEVGCHYRFDQCIGMTKAQRRVLTVEYVQRMQSIAMEAGRPEFT